MEKSQAEKNDKTIVQVIIWGSALAVGASLALLFGVDLSSNRADIRFSVSSVIAFFVGVVLTWLFWKRVFKLANEPKRMWRFIGISVVLFLIAFIGMVLLPQFTPEGTNKRDLVVGMVLGFIAVAFVFYAAKKTMQLLEQSDKLENDSRR